MKIQRRERAQDGTSGRRLLMAEAALAGAVALALFVREFPSLRRELRIYRMAGGLRAGHRYP
ncbi:MULTISPECIES: hypothetical protein [unclassified Streptomyces]|uniref:hypothetical protein n=1 Tax=unclassified Streptomyces TaxID=2593676 RepID=UPI0011522635|nr:hypothetical protein [Streptomyces sp. SLBN-31]TQJ85335.1 hypothetical protein FBY22_4100 [Streptomyces sp. SLBN-31]